VGIFKKILLVVAGELILIMGLFFIFELQTRQEKGELILRSNMVALFYANPADEYKASYRRAFYDFGYPSASAMLKNPFQIKGGYSLNKANFSEFAIILEKDIEKSSDPYLKQAFLSPWENRVQEYGQTLSLNVPLFRGKEKKPYGLVRIEHNLKNFPRDIFYKNLLVYILVGIFYNGFLLAIIFGVFRKPKETVVYLEKGYLKEYALGALKLHYKILGKIIEDHENLQEKKPSQLNPEMDNQSPVVIKFYPERKKGNSEKRDG